MLAIPAKLQTWVQQQQLLLVLLGVPDAARVVAGSHN
jgi:hypothetical protein